MKYEKELTRKSVINEQLVNNKDYGSLQSTLKSNRCDNEIIRTLNVASNCNLKHTVEPFNNFDQVSITISVFQTRRVSRSLNKLASVRYLFPTQVREHVQAPSVDANSRNRLEDTTFAESDAKVSGYVRRFGAIGQRTNEARRWYRDENERADERERHVRRT